VLYQDKFKNLTTLPVLNFCVAAISGVTTWFSDNTGEGNIWDDHSQPIIAYRLEPDPMAFR
jgi:hypothetical protein